MFFQPVRDRNTQNYGSHHVGKMMTIQRDARPHYRHRINYRHRAPPVIYEPQGGHQTHRRRRVAGGKRVELIFADEPNAVMPPRVKTLRQRRGWTCAAKQQPQDQRRQPGDFRSERDKKNICSKLRLFSPHIKCRQQNPRDADHPTFAELGAPPSDIMPRRCWRNHQRAIHRVIQWKHHRDQHGSGEQPEPAAAIFISCHRGDFTVLRLQIKIQIASVRQNFALGFFR